jgi:hypothetical protein
MSLLLPVKYFFSLYIGQLSVLAAAFALFRKNLRINSLLIMCLLASWFLMVDNEGNVSFLRSAANVLPFMKLVRNEWFEWFYPSLFAVLYLTDAVDRFLEEPLGRAHRMAAVLFTALLTACYLFAYNTGAFAGPFVAHLVLIGLFLTLPLLYKRGHLQFVAVSCLVLLDFLLVFSFVAPDEPPQRDQTRMRIAVIDQGSIGKSFRDDNRVHPNFYAIAIQDRLRPPVSESVNWPVLASGLHGAPYINYSPDQYGMFIDDMNLKRFSGWWYNGQERFDFIRLKDSPLLAQMDGKPLFGFLSRSGEQRPAAISFDGISCSSFAFRVGAREPGVLFLNQMFDERWSVRVDGRPGKVLRANNFFMGTEMEPGEHTVEFLFRDGVFTVSLVVSALTLAGLISWRIVRLRREALLARIPPE